MRTLSCLGIIAALALATSAARACDCAEKYLNVVNGKEAAKFVFSGDPLSKEGHYGDMLYVFRIESVWKGAMLKQTYVHGGKDSCGFAFRVGTSYLVLGHGGRGTADDPVLTSICASNKELIAATADVKALGKPLTFYERDKRGAPPAGRRAAYTPPPPPRYTPSARYPATVPSTPGPMVPPN